MRTKLKQEMLAIGKMVASKTEDLSKTLDTFHRLEALTLYMSNSIGADVFPSMRSFLYCRLF
jgi:hypothetical protein